MVHRRAFVRRDDEFGGPLLVEDTGTRTVQIGENETVGIVADDVLFRLPNDPDATFTVEYVLAEDDGSSKDFVNRITLTHRLDGGRARCGRRVGPTKRIATPRIPTAAAPGS